MLAGKEVPPLEQRPAPTMTPDSLFQDAEELRLDALRLFEQGDIRDAAEKAWGATVSATRALVLHRTGELMERTDLLSGAFREVIFSQQPRQALRTLRQNYFERQQLLHGACFYLGICDPPEAIDTAIQETADYIQAARRLAR